MWNTWNTYYTPKKEDKFLIFFAETIDVQTAREYNDRMFVQQSFSTWQKKSKKEEWFFRAGPDTDTLIETDEKIDELLDALVDESHRLVLHNDDHNTFDWVIKALVDICKHHPHQAEQCSLLVHYKGKCSVKEGSMDQLKPLKDGLTDRGLSATIE